MVMTKFVTKLIRQEEVAHETRAFHFERPAGFEFTAGQSVDLTLIDAPETDSEGNARTFSIASAPYENEIVIASRMRNTAFKRVLMKTSSGLKLELEGPSGDFKLHRDIRRPGILIAGGIGITPFRSILRQAIHERLSHSIILFHSNRRLQDVPFYDELLSFKEKLPRFQLIPTITNIDSTPKSWTGETGHIDERMIRHYIKDLNVPIFYLAGPSGMVQSVKTMLLGAGINEDNVRSESFSGY